MRSIALCGLDASPATGDVHDRNARTFVTTHTGDERERNGDRDDVLDESSRRV